MRKKKNTIFFFSPFKQGGKKKKNHHKQPPTIITTQTTTKKNDRPQPRWPNRQRHQLKRPVGEWKHRRPCARDPSHQRRMFEVTPFKPASKRPGFQNIRVQVAAEVGDDQKAHPNRYKSGQQKRNSPSRFNAVQPTQKRPTPTRRGIIRAGSHI